MEIQSKGGESVKKILSIFLVMMLGVFIYFMFIRQNQLVVNIHNGSDKDISGLQLVTDESILLADVNTIKPDEEKEFVIELPENIDEASVDLSYTDKQGNQHSEVIHGYVEQGYVGVGEVRIHSIDENGIIHMDIEAETNIFQD